jgi:predicted nucleic acid-binding protein
MRNATKPLSHNPTMKELFKWSIPLEEDEIKNIWENGILTVDTNVLLDLYRYHHNTRKALLASLYSFNNRAWISYQVADEFLRNRSGVIVSAKSAFSEAERLITEVSKSIEEPLKKLKSSRIIPDELEEKLENAIKSAVDEAMLSI